MIVVLDENRQGTQAFSERLTTTQKTHEEINICSQPATYRTSSVNQSDTAATRPPGTATLGWDALGIAARSALNGRDRPRAAACCPLPTSSSRPPTAGRSPTARSLSPFTAAAAFRDHGSACHRRAPYCFPMVNIGGGLQDKAANGRRRRAVAPKAIQQRACVPLNMLLLSSRKVLRGPL